MGQKFFDTSDVEFPQTGKPEAVASGEFPIDDYAGSLLCNECSHEVYDNNEHVPIWPCYRCGGYKCVHELQRDPRDRSRAICIDSVHCGRYQELNPKNSQRWVMLPEWFADRVK